jgi:spore germination cell wall hydrolase CwlJ-like protein
MTNLFLTIALLLPVSAPPSEEGCLAKIMFAESRGESIEGAIAVGQAAVNRAKRTGKTICKITGKDSIVENSDSWNTGTKPKYKGAIVRQIGDHVFYVMSRL